MKGREIILGSEAGRDVAVLIVDGVLQDLFIDSDAPRPGAVLRGRVTRPIKGLGGAFLDTSEGPAFLRGGAGLAAGREMLVQVSGYAERGKAIPVSYKLLFKSRFAIVTPGSPGMNISRSIKDEELRLAVRAAAETERAEASDHGVILRSSCAAGEGDEIAEDVDAMLALADMVMSDTGQGLEKLVEGPAPHELAWRDWTAEQVREADIGEWLDLARRPETRLAGGASVCVEPTRAFVAVDVNTGSDASPAAGLKANIATAADLPRLLRIKGLGGQIVVDFAPAPKKDRKAIENALRRALRDDDVETALVGWTQMGHYELNRKRARVALGVLAE